MSDEYDVIIVGAGPAGLNCARFINPNESGVSVLVIDKKSEIGKPVQCGEAIPGKHEFERGFPGVKRHFEHHNINYLPVPHDAIAQHLLGFKFILPNGKHKKIATLGHTLFRDKWEKWLADDAERRGIKIKLNTHSIDMNDEYKVVVGADGINSQIARSFGLDVNTSYAICSTAHTDFDCQSGYGEIYLDKKYGHGYAWAFPQGKQMNVGVGVMDSDKDRVILVRNMLKEFLGISCDYHCTDRVINWSGGTIPMGGPLNDITWTWGDNDESAALIGDAAGLVFPMNGGGIIPAMVSGAVLGGYISAVNRPHRYKQAVIQYDATIKHLLYENLRTSLKYKKRMSFIGRSNFLLNTIIGHTSSQRLADMMLGM